MYKNERILITGGAGFIGSHLTQKLLNEGHPITVVDCADFSSSSLGKLSLTNHPSVTCLSGSITDEDIWSRLPKNIGYIVHAAAVLGIERVSREQIETMDASILGTRLCLKFAAQLPKLRRFIYLSTSEIYGVSGDSSAEQDPAIIRTDGRRWCYSAAKLAGEFYVKAFAERAQFPYVIVRPFNVYGPNRIGENAMTTIARRAVANEVIRISGTGLQTRSWCYIDDFLEGLVKCIYLENGTSYTFNLGNDREEMTIRQLAELVRTTAKSFSNIVVDGIIQEDIANRRPDLTNARRLLAYNPCISVQEGTKRVIDWIRATSP